MSRKVTDYVSRLSQYYKIYGQVVSMQQAKYRLKVSDDIEVHLLQDRDNVVVTINCRLGRNDIFKDLSVLLERLNKECTDDISIQVSTDIDADMSADMSADMGVDIAESSNVFGGM